MAGGLREDDEIARRGSRRCVLHIKDLRRDIYVLILGGCSHEVQSDSISVGREDRNAGARGRQTRQR